MITIADRGDGIFLVADTDDKQAALTQNVPGFIVHTNHGGQVNPVHTQSTLKMGYWDAAYADPERDKQIADLIKKHKGE